MDTKFKIIIVGAGGTGGNFIKEFGRYLYSANIRQHVEIIIIDGDQVEKRNLVRQPFLEQDIGKNKAEVMAEILSEVYGITCSYDPNYIEHLSQIVQYEEQDKVLMIVSAVDNHHCRKLLHQYFMTAESCFLFDSANEYSCGEVVVGARLMNQTLHPDRMHYFPEIMQEETISKGEESCLEKNISSPQHLVTNLWACNILLKAVIEVLEQKSWSGGIYYFDAFKGFCRFDPNKGD